MGFLGEVPLQEQIAHSCGFASAAEAVSDSPPQRFIDLGSGGGLPGLVLSSLWPASRALLLDANVRRTGALASAIELLGYSGRVEVIRARAEDAGRDPALRATQDLVVARSFGRPAVVAECAAPFLRPGGLLIVSEPPVSDQFGPPMGDRPELPAGGNPELPRPNQPDSVTAHPDRWPAEPLAELGLRAVSFEFFEFGYQVLRQEMPCPDRYSRRSGVPAKRPLFG